MIRSNVCPRAANQRTKTRVGDTLREWCLPKGCWQSPWVVFITAALLVLCVEVHSNWLLWSQGWLAVTANTLAPSASLLARPVRHERRVSMQTLAVSELTPCGVCRQGKRREQRDWCSLICMCECKYSLSFSWLQLWPTRSTRFPPRRLRGIRTEITRLNNTTAIRRTSTLMWKDYKVHFNYSKSCLNNSSGF